MVSTDELAKRWQLEAQLRKGRIEYCKFQTLHDLVKARCIFLYSAGPIDEWTGWEELYRAPIIFYDEEMRQGKESARSKILTLESLLINGLTKFNDLSAEKRGEPLHFCEVEVENLPGCYPSTVKKFVVGIKMDNNGTCYAFSELPNLNGIIPHEQGDKWELVDAYKLD